MSKVSLIHPARPSDAMSETQKMCGLSGSTSTPSPREVQLHSSLLSDVPEDDVTPDTDGPDISLVALETSQSTMNSHLSGGSNYHRKRADSLITKYKSEYHCEFGCKLKEQSSMDMEKTKKASRQLLQASIFCFLFMVAELIGGILANSLALISDACHLLSDFAGLGISMFALWLVNTKAKSRSSFGYHRAEIIGALFSIVLIWGLTVYLVSHAFDRLIHPKPIDGEIMFIVACLGIVVNCIMGYILSQGGHHSHGLPGSATHGHSHSHRDFEALSGLDDDEDHNHSNKNHSNGMKMRHRRKNTEESVKGDERNINVRSAFVHVIGDLVQSVGVVIAASFIWYDGDTFQFMDPVCTLVFSLIVIYTTYHLIRDAINILMENVPAHIDIHEMEEALMDIPDVHSVHCIHVWNLSVGKMAMSAHLVIKSTTMRNGHTVPACLNAILKSAQSLLRDRFGIEHSTIQLEFPGSLECRDPDGMHPEYCSSPGTSQKSKSLSYPHIHGDPTGAEV